jgi:hypothetical protein
MEWHVQLHFFIEILHQLKTIFCSAKIGCEDFMLQAFMRSEFLRGEGRFFGMALSYLGKRLRNITVPSGYFSKPSGYLSEASRKSVDLLRFFARALRNSETALGYFETASGYFDVLPRNAERGAGYFDSFFRSGMRLT